LSVSITIRIRLKVSLNMSRNFEVFCKFIFDL
jgi:hypothetical protein